MAAPGAAPMLASMLAFDIETTGLDPAKCVVTVVCTQDYRSGERRTYEFARMQDERPEDCAELVRELTAALDAAPALCAFNGVRFDLPFLETAFRLQAAQVAGWVLKTSDILEHCRLQHGCTFSLNMLCEANGVQVKSSSGMEAVYMAQRREWQRLREYCADDVQILCDLYRRRRLVNPRTRGALELAEVAPPGLFVAAAAESAESAAAESAESAESAVSGAAAAGAAAAGAAAVVSSSSPQARVREGLVALRRQLAEMALALAALEAASEAAFR